MRKIFAIIALFVAISATAQKVRFDICFTTENANVDKVLIQPLNISEGAQTVVAREKDGHFVGNVVPSTIGFSNLVIVFSEAR